MMQAPAVPCQLHHQRFHLGPRPAALDRLPVAVAGSTPLPPAGADGTWRLALPDLPDLPAGWMLVPSVARLGAAPGASHRWLLQYAGGSAALAWFPTRAGDARAGAADGPGVRTEVDWFHSSAPLAGVALQLHLDPPPGPEETVLVAVSARPVQAAGWSTDAADAPPVLLGVPERCQYHCPPLHGRAVGGHVCSPTSLAILAAHQGVAWPLDAAAAACHDPRHRLFGVWPQNIQAAADRGLAGWVRCFSSLDDLRAHLRAGLPVAVSIRFGPGELPGAALQQTGGHLLVVRGLAGGRVLVNDPACRGPAPNSLGLPAAAFARAWLGTRGIGYVVVGGQP